MLAAIACGYLIFATTFGSSESLKRISVKVLGFRAPLGAFVAAWGGIAMLTSAPFDNWWHAAYGLDVKIVSPPHTLLILGIRAVGVGVLFLILAAMNRASEAGAAGEKGFHSLQRLFLYLGGLIISGQMFFLMEYTWDVYLHGSTAYVAMAIGIPVALAMISRASQHRWAATIAASVYTIFVIGEILILPLFSAQPKLGPVYFPVTHFVPAKFPILIIAPALALDLLWKRTRSWKSWQVALLSGLVFVAVLVAVEWPFASFLMTPAAANRFFGTIYFDYNSPSWGVDRMRRVLAARTRRRALSRVRNRRDLRLDQHLDRTGLRRMDAEGPALKAFRVILLALGLRSYNLLSRMWAARTSFRRSRPALTSYL